ncbi:serine/threonine protein kinase [Actinobacteria bacterium OK074]|nr:serine/threonine protein kinase [Actinobacteria bacterium OK074]
MAEEPGRERVIAGRYRLLSPLGEGGMGTVWRARDEVLQREVAVKEVRAPAGLPSGDIDRMYARLEREAWAAARVSNRNVVTVYDVAMQDGRPWIVMELVRGISLADLLEAEGPLSPRRTAEIGAEVLSALRAAHEAGVLHRDVKPGNVLIANDGRVVLTDFGIATVEGSSALTMTGEVIGSPEFLAPERALGRRPGPESDLWSLGVLIYAAVEGSSPFRQDTPLSTLRAVVDEALPPPRRAGPLAPVIEGLLRKDPADRIPAEQAEQELRLIAAGGTPTSGTPAYPPTVGAGFPSPPVASPSDTPPYGRPPPTRPSPYAAPATTAAGTAAPPERDRRTALVLIAGVVALALAVAGITYALLNDNGGGKTPQGGSGSNSASVDSGSGGAPTSGSSGSSTATGTTGSTAPAGGGGSTTGQPAQSVKVTVTGVHTDYTGVCPLQQAQAPTFTATFTVGRVPAQVQYRWVLGSGEMPDPGWKTLSFASGGQKTKQTQVFVTTYDTSGTIDNSIGVEVRSPVQATSNSVPFSVTCTTATSGSPTTETSASASSYGNGQPDSRS